MPGAAKAKLEFSIPDHVKHGLCVIGQVYKAERPGAALRVYNLWYSDSLESDRFAVALSREQKVFEDLIQQKAYIVLPDLQQVCISSQL